MTKQHIKPFTYISLFSGIGGFEAALDQLGGRLLLSSEKDNLTDKCYALIHGSPTRGDVTKIDENTVPDHDMLVGGFPCQAFSIAGKRKGFSDTRGTLFFSIARIAKRKRPKYIVLENVPGLLSHEKGDTFEVIVSTLSELGYCVDFHVVNSQAHGVPQSRQRLYILGIREDLIPHATYQINHPLTLEDKLKKRFTERGLRSFNFDWSTLKKHDIPTRLIDLATSPVQGNLFPSADVLNNFIEGQSTSKTRLIFAGGIKDNMWLKTKKNRSRDFSQGDRIYDALGVSSTLTSSSVGGFGKYSSLYLFPVKKPINKDKHLYDTQIIMRNGKPHTLWKPKDNSKTTEYELQYDPSSTDCVIRALSPLETYRLQGFPDDYEKQLVKHGISERQLYKMSGNAVSVPVVKHVVEHLFQYIEDTQREEE